MISLYRGAPVRDLFRGDDGEAGDRERQCLDADTASEETNAGAVMNRHNPSVRCFLATGTILTMRAQRGNEISKFCPYCVVRNFGKIEERKGFGLAQAMPSERLRASRLSWFFSKYVRTGASLSLRALATPALRSAGCSSPLA